MTKELNDIFLRYYDIEELLESITGENKYLDLAYAMHSTRLQWADGFYLVKYALGRFHSKITSVQDQEIFSDVSNCMGEDDGRVFRDTKWGYDALYTLVPPQLMKDFDIVRNICE